MNTKIVEQAVDETLQELLAMPARDFKNLLKRKSCYLKKILLDGDFISCLGESTSKEELLKGFPDLAHNFIPLPPEYEKSHSDIEHYFSKDNLSTSLDGGQAAMQYSSDLLNYIEMKQVFSDMTFSGYKRLYSNIKCYFGKDSFNTSLDSGQATIQHSSDLINSFIGTEQIFSYVILDNQDDAIFKTTQPHKNTNESETWTEQKMQEAA